MSPTLEKTNSSVGYIRDNTTKTLPTRGIVSIHLIKIWPMKMLYFLKLDQSNWNYKLSIIF
jgi:hypothetical protein